MELIANSKLPDALPPGYRLSRLASYSVCSFDFGRIKYLSEKGLVVYTFNVQRVLSLTFATNV